MTIHEACANIGNPFKVEGFTGLAGRFDIIRVVDSNGVIYGDFIEAPCEDCRLKMEQPVQLKKVV